MKYQTEYQRNYQPKVHVPSVEERRLNEVPMKRSVSRRGRSVPSSPIRRSSNDNFAVIGPNDKFSESHLYRLREPIKDHPRVAKSQEYALLGRNEKFESNVVYPLRKPVTSDSPRMVIRRRKKDKHSCGIQTELGRTNWSSYKQEPKRERRRNVPQSEYRTSYNWVKPANDQPPIDQSRLRKGYSDPEISTSHAKSPKKTSVAVNTPARVEIDVNKAKQARKRAVTSVAKPVRPRRDETSEYRTRYKPPMDSRGFEVPKAYEAEQVDQRIQKRREIEKPDRAYSDDEGAKENVDLGKEFRQKHPYGKLRRWKSEYQSTYKPFWRFDYKNGKWYKDNSADEKGFNRNLFWYKELMSTRKRADEYRANAETDHFNRQHTLQLQTGFSVNNNTRAWDVDDDDSSDSVISIDQDLERERREGERRREKDAKRKEEERNQYKKYPKSKPIEKPSTIETDEIPQNDHRMDRVVYIDEPAPKEPSAATKAFVRNLGSSSIQQHMNWESESLNTQRTASDLNSFRKSHTHPNPRVRAGTSKKQQSRGTRIYSPLPSDRPAQQQQPPPPQKQQHQQSQTNGYTSPYAVRPPGSYQETTNATGRPSYDGQTFDKRPHTSNNQYCTYPGSRFKDEVTEYYYGSDDNRHTPVSKPSFPNHFEAPDNRYGPPRPKDDDVLSTNSARSLSSSCSLASQTLERAQQNMSKYWADHSPRKSSYSKH